MVNRTASKSPPSTPKEVAAKEDKRTAPATTSGKKMKQTRLSFAGKEAGGDGLRKRKLSSPETENDRTVKVVRMEGDPPADDSPVVLIDDDDEETPREKKRGKAGAATKKEDAKEVIENQDADMVEIIDYEESNSAAAPSSAADVSLVEEDDDDEDEPDVVDEEEEEEEEDTNEEDDPINESINLDNSSCDIGGNGNENGLPFPLEPPSSSNGKPLTPRQLEKWMEKKARHEERLKQKAEREKKLEDERKQREERERLRKREREEKEEAKRKEKEEKEAARLREKEEREKKKLLELEQKNEEKRRKEEQRDEEKRRREEQKEEERRRREEQKEEERRRKEEEKRQKELEDEQKKKRASQAFTKFFKVGPKVTASADEDGQGGAGLKGSTDDVVEVVNQFFMPFAIKGDMKLAPTVRRVLTKEAKSSLEALLKEPSGKIPVQELYVKSLKTKSHAPLKGTKTWITSDSSDDESDDDLMVVDDERAHTVEKGQKKKKYRAKCLMFHENRRPAYYGTWMKKSKIVRPRNPFAKDEKTFDYEVDSDDEWEEEEPGESLHGSDDEKEKESEDDYEVDNEFFVPHGHLSDEEMQNEDNEMDDNSPETQKVKLKLLQDEFNDEMKKKTQKIKPRLIGCIWADAKGGRPENCPEVFWDLLQFRAVLSAGPIVLRAPPGEQPDNGEDDADAEDEEKVDRRKGQGLTEEEVRDLIRLLHGNVNSKKFIVKEFKVHLEKKVDTKSAVPRVLTDMTILRKIKEIAVRGTFWVVQQEFLDQFNLSDLPLTNAWEYTLTPKRTVVATDKKPVPAADTPSVVDVEMVVSTAAAPVPKTPVRPQQEKESPPSAKQKTNRNSITQFTKVLTNEEKQKQFQSISISSPKTTPAAASANENRAPTSIAAASVSLAMQPVVVLSPGAITTATVAAPPAKKRVPLLMSVPRGQAISEQSKSELIKNFLTKQPPGKGAAPVTEGEDLKKNTNATEPMVTETIVLD